MIFLRWLHSRQLLQFPLPSFPHNPGIQIHFGIRKNTLDICRIWINTFWNLDKYRQHPFLKIWSKAANINFLSSVPRVNQDHMHSVIQFQWTEQNHELPRRHVQIARFCNIHIMQNIAIWQLDGENWRSVPSSLFWCFPNSGWRRLNQDSLDNILLTPLSRWIHCRRSMEWALHLW